MTWSGREGGPVGPYRKIRAITPSDGADLSDGPCQAIFATAGGNVSIDMTDGTSALVVPIAAGYTEKLELNSIKRVRATATTATGLFALYV
jgi:hypothetical protein